MRLSTIGGVLFVLVASCGGEVKPAETAVSATPGQLATGAQNCGATAAVTQMMSGTEVSQAAGGCKEAKASTASTEPLTANTDATCQGSLTATGQTTCVEAYPGTPKKWGVWGADKKKSADCYCAQ